MSILAIRKVASITLGKQYSRELCELLLNVALSQLSFFKSLSHTTLSMGGHFDGRGPLYLC